MQIQLSNDEHCCANLKAIFIINVVCCVGRVEIYKPKYKKVGVLPIRIVKFNVSSIGPSSETKTFSL